MHKKIGICRHIDSAIRVAFVGYSDHCDDEGNGIECLDFGSLEVFETYLGQVQATSRRKTTRGALSGLVAALGLSWSQRNRIIIHIAGTAKPGRRHQDVSDFGDVEMDDLVKYLDEKSIGCYTFGKINYLERQKVEELCVTHGDHVEIHCTDLSDYDRYQHDFPLVAVETIGTLIVNKVALLKGSLAPDRLGDYFLDDEDEEVSRVQKKYTIEKKEPNWEDIDEIQVEVGKCKVNEIFNMCIVDTVTVNGTYCVV